MSESSRLVLPVPGSLGHLQLRLLIKRPELNNVEIAELVQKLRPGCKTTAKCVAHYRCKYRSYLPIGPSPGGHGPKHPALRLVA